VSEPKPRVAIYSESKQQYAQKIHQRSAENVGANSLKRSAESSTVSYALRLLDFVFLVSSYLTIGRTINRRGI
jgi:hypothetical protein